MLQTRLLSWPLLTSGYSVLAALKFREGTYSVLVAAASRPPRKASAETRTPLLTSHSLISSLYPYPSPLGLPSWGVETTTVPGASLFNQAAVRRE